MNKTIKNSKESAYERIQDLILGMDIKPGETITEIALSNRLGIGRTPVREALKKLEQEGLIITTNRRKRVNILTIKEIEDIFEIKCCLEAHVAQTAARVCNSKDVKAFEKILGDMKQAAHQRVNTEEEEQKRLDAWLNADRRFHHQLFEMSGNSKIEQITRNLDLQWQRLRLGIYTLEGRMIRSFDEHNSIIQAVIAKEPEEAGKRMAEHLTKVKNELVKLFKMFHYPVE